MTEPARLAAARRDVAGFDPLPGPADLVAGYALQDGLAEAVAAERGGIAGFKLAVNGAPQMAHFGVAEPVCARLFGAERHESGARVPRAGFQAVTIEPEIAAILGAVPEGPVDRAGALAAIDRFLPAIELVDMRGLALPQLALAQAVALNVFNAGVVLGGPGLAPADLDIASLPVTLTIDGTEAGAVTGGAPQDPVEAVRWLLTHLAGRGVAVRPGMVVMCGAHLPLLTLPEGAGRVDADMGPLGAVGFSLS